MKEKLASIIKGIFGNETVVEFSVPEEPVFGHYATNMAMRLAKASGQAPLKLAEELAEKIKAGAPAGFFEKVETAPPGFINFWLSKETIQEELRRVAGDEAFGVNMIGGGKTVIVEYSSVNIAKAMNLGHFRTTIIGDALANILAACGYRVLRWNYLGDWGTQFGKLIAAYKLWGEKETIEKNPVEELQKLYVRFHEEAKKSPEIEKAGQEEFKKLEDGDPENRKLWEWFKEESLKEFEETYARLGIHFDIWVGESFFEKDLKPVTKELLEKKIAERSEGALVVRFDGQKLPPALIEKSDGASLYLTRDIANLRYRLTEYKPAKMLYVVANEQTLHFEQLFAIARLLGLDSAELKHIKYGMVLGESGKKFSTREGNSVAVSETITKAVRLAGGVVEKKNAELSVHEREEVAEAVGIGALKYNDLKENRMTDIVFDWGKMLDFTGDSAPYLQYTYARLRSILRKAEPSEMAMAGKIGTEEFSAIGEEQELALARKIFEFPDIVRRSGELYSTSTLATYLYKLTVAANRFYETIPIIKDENAARRAARLALIVVAARTLRSGLGLLGIKAPEKI